MTALFGGSQENDPMAAAPVVYNAQGFSGIVSFSRPTPRTAPSSRCCRTMAPRCPHWWTAWPT
ncbi:hypothetical protein [Novosphingobium resinovorum]|uniref:hypothetical protein n=1 Tax=Novosphingobium resinovorum TaxID=158500 RepID=UPI003D28CAC3